MFKISLSRSLPALRFPMLLCSSEKMSEALFFTFLPHHRKVGMEISQEKRNQPKQDVGVEENAEIRCGCESDWKKRPDFLPEDSGVKVPDACDSSPESTISLLESDNKDWSDCSISDDESLIEIELQGEHYLEEDRFFWEKDFPVVGMPEYAFQKKDFQAFETPESIFRRQLLMELCSELIEEDNLIEIDLSVGSIKCSRVEIDD
ncbi:uncharacterized protein LOC116259155 isoform X1 [Nymphaea colorata]|nr:uncharacterized protein LOC116259155 isoform X1 [Nymphaea colorata]